MSERTIAGRYALLHPIGDGGMATVWVAVDQQLQRRVALKLVQPGRGSKRRNPARFEQEARIVAQLQDPAVVQVHDYGLNDGEPFVVMELLSGEDLETRLGRVERLPLAAVTSLVSQVARGLEVAHAAGIVHRDLKPGNIFLSRTTQGEQAKILDFGLAAIRPAEGGVGELLPIAGTPQYMSPEQICSPASVDHRTDLYALGVLVYRALTGVLPFSGASSASLLWQICNPEVAPTAPTRLCPELPAAIDDFLNRALARDRQARFQSAREFAAALATLGHAEPPQVARLLVVDDEPDMAALLRQRLRSQIRQGRYELFAAGDGEEALAQLRKRPDIDLVLADINMPRMDGLTLLGHIHAEHPGIGVVMVTAYGDMPNIRAAMNRGALDFLNKPLDLDDLERTIERSVQQVRGARRAARSGEENAVLRMFVGSGLVERLVPALRTVGPLAEAREGTALFIDTHAAQEDAAAPATEPPLRRLSERIDAVLLEVSARGGALEKILGDQALAVFYGDDHLTQALRAALSLQTRHPELSQGVDSGPLWAGSVGSSTYSRMDFTVCGPIVRSAQELCARARPGQVLVRRELEPFLVRRFSVTPLPHSDPGDASDPNLGAAAPLGNATVAVCAVNPVRGPSSQEHTRALSPIPLGALVSDSG